MRRSTARGSIYCLLLALVHGGGALSGVNVAWAMADSSRKAPAPKEHGVEREAVEVAAQILFSDEDRRLILEYYRGERVDDNGGKRDKAKQAPPGLAKREQLPPGLQKQLERNGQLPPGLEGRGLPGDLEGRLPRLSSRYERRRVGDDVVLIDVATRVILDIVYGVGR